MSTARTSTLANLRGRIERIETHGDAPDLNKVALGHAAADATLRGGLAVAAVHEVFAEGHQSAAATGLHRGAGGKGIAAPAAGLGAAGFFGNRIRCAVDERALRTRPRSAAAGDRARPRHRRRVADRRRRAGLRCARRRRAGSLGAGAPARSRRQPQTHAGRGSLRRHRACFCGWPRSRGPRPRKPDGSCARRIRRLPHPGPPGARRCSTRNWFVNRHGPVGRWIMEWNCDECLFSEPAAYPQPVAATPAHRPHQAAMQSCFQTKRVSKTLSARPVRSLSRLRGRVGVGVPPRVRPFAWREPPPGSHQTMRSDLRASFARLDRKRER